MRQTLTFLRSNAIALTALFVALAGTSYAALSLPAGSVGTRQLRNHSVTARKLARHSVTARSLDPKSIAGHVLAWAQIRQDQVVLSSPRASTFDPLRGLIKVTWHHPISSKCIAVANPTNEASGQAVSVTTFGPENLPGGTGDFTVGTLDANGTGVPENFNIVVICP